MIVGLPHDATVITHAGSASVFEESGGTWTEVAKVYASDAHYWAFFGTDVAIDGTTALVGCPRNDSTADEAGAAYVFERTVNDWVERTKLIGSGLGWLTQFGNNVALEGTRALIGALFVGPNSSGAAYLFEGAGSSWVETAKFQPISP